VEEWLMCGTEPARAPLLHLPQTLCASRRRGEVGSVPLESKCTLHSAVLTAREGAEGCVPECKYTQRKS